MSASMQTEEVLNVTSKLKEKVDRVPVLAALCSIFAKRERSRNEITVMAMYVNLIKEGRSFSKSQIRDAFRLLEQAGVGELQLDSKSQITSLKNIRVPLPDIGQTLGLRPERRKAPQIIEQAPRFKPSAISGSQKLVKIKLTLSRDGETMSFDSEKNMSSSEMLEFIGKVLGKV